MSDRVATAVRIPRRQHEILRAEADARDVSVNFLVNRAITLYLSNLTPARELD